MFPGRERHSHQFIVMGYIKSDGRRTDARHLRTTEGVMGY